MKNLFYPLIALGLFAVACSSEEEENQTSNTTAENDLADLRSTTESEVILNDLDVLALDVLEDGQVGFKMSSSLLQCAMVVRDTTQSTPAFTIDFGPTNCLGPDGRNRRGKLYVKSSGPYFTPGTLIEVSSINYYVNDWAVLGQRATTNLGFNAAGNLYWSITSNLQFVKANASDTLNWKSQREREFSKGAFNASLTDNEFTITGKANITSSQGFSWHATITRPLIYKHNCQWLSHGEIEIQRANFALRQIDYGSGLCDNKATLTVGNSTINITLR